MRRYNTEIKKIVIKVEKYISGKQTSAAVLGCIAFKIKKDLYTPGKQLLGIISELNIRLHGTMMAAGPSYYGGEYYEVSDDDEMVNLDFIDIAKVLLADFVDMVKSASKNVLFSFFFEKLVMKRILSMCL